MRTEPKIEREVVLSDLGEAQRVLELAKEVMARSMTAHGRLAAIGQVATARRLLDEAKQMIEHVASWAKAS